MGFNDFTNKLRQWDNRSSQWFIRHFYMLFFEIMLVAIFVAVFVNTLKIIDINTDLHHLSGPASPIERLMFTQTINTLMIVILLLFNSFWMLYIFSSLLRLRSLLKNIDFNLSKRRNDKRSNDS